MTQVLKLHSIPSQLLQEIGIIRKPSGLLVKEQGTV